MSKSRVIHALKQAARGCTTLPHVGPHPGTAMMVFFVAIGGAIGIQRGGLPGAVCAVAVLAIFGPLYLLGAHDRATISDELESDPSREQNG